MASAAVLNGRRRNLAGTIAAKLRGCEAWTLSRHGHTQLAILPA